MNTILIIEDDPYVRSMYQKLFNLQDYNVLMAKNGQEGIDLALAHNPKVILLDLIMPNMNGLDVLKSLKSRTETKDIPVLILTNMGDDAAIKQASALGADAFMIKSDFTPDQVLSQVNSYMKEYLKTHDVSS